MYIYRELLDKIIDIYVENGKAKPLSMGIILSGIVGCGKTTLIEKLIEQLKMHYQVFQFTGDDSVFRQKVSLDSKYIYEEVRRTTSERAFIFVDEVQKSEEIFDALKYAFDQGKISFIVSGSNPAYLSTVAKKRLQRRAEQFIMLPISLKELALHNNWVQESMANQFQSILWKHSSLNDIQLPLFTINPNIHDIIKNYFLFGGLPRALIAQGEENKLREIRLTTERGFELMSIENNSVADAVRIELAQLNSQEFTYKTIFDKTRTRKREVINGILDELINHGYLVKKKPVLLHPGKTSYLTIYAYVDPGIVTYLTGDRSTENIGFKVEGYVHSQLNYLIQNSVYKSELGYYKSYSLDINKNIRYGSGEIDFIFKSGMRIIPIEVKSSGKISDISTEKLIQFIKDHNLAFGIVLYGGAPFIDQQKKLLFWPYWLI